MLLLEAGQVKKYYSDRLIIAFADLKIYTGDRIGIIGPNGSGKTTLLNILSKELEPDEGYVNHFCDITYIHQFSDEIIQARTQVLKELALDDKLHQKVFSGGEQTRIRIANAFSYDNRLILADEPTANLDYQGIQVLMDKLSTMETYLLISHDRFLLDQLCNKILEVNNGKVMLYNGGYSFYQEQNARERQSGQREYAKYLAERG